MFLPRLEIGTQDDVADGPAAFHQLVGVGDALERQLGKDSMLQPTTRGGTRQGGDGVASVFRPQVIGEQESQGRRRPQQAARVEVDPVRPLQLRPQGLAVVEAELVGPEVNEKSATAESSPLLRTLRAAAQRDRRLQG